MIKRMIILIIMGLTLSSCQEIAIIKYSIDDAKQQAEIRKITNPYYGKDGAWSYQTNKEVFNVVKEVLKRPINKKVEFGGTTLLIPENTRINSKHGNIVDEKTGYGIAITFEITERCSSVYYRKKIKEGLYCKIYYNGINSELNIISKKIINTNGFTNTCK